MGEQTNLLNRAAEEGTARYNKKLQQLPVATPWGREMAKQLIPKMVDAIKQWATKNSQRKAGVITGPCLKILKGDIEAIAYLTVRTLFSAMIEEQALTSTAFQIASAVEFEVEGKKAWKKMPEGVRRKMTSDIACKRGLRQKNYKHFYSYFGYMPEWDIKERCRVGIHLTYLFKDVTGLIEFVNVAHGTKKLKTHIVLTPEAREWVKDYNSVAEILRPVKYPTVEPLIPWNIYDLYSGGYPELITYPLVKIRRKEDREALKKANMTVPVNAVNGMQSVPWKINTKMLDVMKEYFRRGLCVNDVIPFNGVVEIPQYNPEVTDEVGRKEYKRQAFNAHLTNFQNKTRAFIVAKMICIADSLKSYPEIYFPLQLDFRGRMYCFNELLHYQGNDPSRALLLFSKGCVLGEEGMKWLAIHGANKWGLDKETFEVRETWVRDNLSMIKQSAEDPVGCNWWTEADDPWQFLAFCMEYAEAAPDSVSYFPCSLDATNNGLQILSLLMRDTVGAERTNVANTSSPNDLYKLVAEALKTHLQSLSDPMAAQLLATGLVNRKLVKTTVMTVPYGVTRYGITRCLDTSLAKSLHLNPATQAILPMSERREVSKWLTKHLIEVMEPLLGESKKCMDWLHSIAVPFVTHSQPMQWKTPSGFLVHNDYRKYSEIEIKTAIGDKFDYRNVLVEQPEMDGRAALRTLAPNYVHSLDASVAHFVAQKLGYMGLSFGIVHDCFVSHAANLTVVKDLVKQVYHKVFSDDRLSILHDELQKQIPETQLEKIPTTGKFLVDEILDSTYFIS